MGCANGLASLSSVEECHHRRFVVESVSLPAECSSRYMTPLIYVL
jgi:hypothetical protein